VWVINWIQRLSNGAAIMVAEMARTLVWLSDEEEQRFVNMGPVLLKLLDAENRRGMIRHSGAISLNCVKVLGSILTNAYVSVLQRTATLEAGFFETYPTALWEFPCPDKLQESLRRQRLRVLTVAHAELFEFAEGEEWHVVLLVGEIGARGEHVVMQLSWGESGYRELKRETNIPYLIAERVLISEIGLVVGAKKKVTSEKIAYRAAAQGRTVRGSAQTVVHSEGALVGGVEGAAMGQLQVDAAEGELLIDVGTKRTVWLASPNLRNRNGRAFPGVARG
jgi:hypothetical protein